MFFCDVQTSLCEVKLQEAIRNDVASASCRRGATNSDGLRQEIGGSPATSDICYLPKILMEQPNEGRTQVIFVFPHARTTAKRRQRYLTGGIKVWCRFPEFWAEWNFFIRTRTGERGWVRVYGMPGIEKLRAPIIPNGEIRQQKELCD